MRTPRGRPGVAVAHDTSDKKRALITQTDFLVQCVHGSVNGPSRSPGFRRGTDRPAGGHPRDLRARGHQSCRSAEQLGHHLPLRFVARTPRRDLEPARTANQHRAGGAAGRGRARRPPPDLEQLVYAYVHPIATKLARDEPSYWARFNEQWLTTAPLEFLTVPEPGAVRADYYPPTSRWARCRRCWTESPTGSTFLSATRDGGWA